MSKYALPLAALALGLTIGAGPVLAQSLEHEGLPPSDPVLALGQRLAPHNEFFLNSERDVELVRFSTMHDNTVCVPRVDRRIGTVRQSVGIKVKWDNSEATIEPGHCLSFDAKSVKVSPAAALPDDVELVGTIRTTK